MKNFRWALLGSALVAAATLPAMAQPGPNAAGPTAAGPGRGGPAAMFGRIDTNNDGRITWEEGWAFVQARFAEADKDRDGGLTMAEMEAARPFGRGGAHAHGPRHAQYGGMMFRALDADRDGKLTLAEVRPASEARFRGLDANADNAVTRDELPAPRRRAAPPAAPAPAR